MEAKEVKSLMEAYASIYEHTEEVQQLDEELTGERLKRAEDKMKSLSRRKKSDIPSIEALNRVSIGKEGTGVLGGKKAPVKRGGAGIKGYAKTSGTAGYDMDRGYGNKAARRAAAPKNEEVETDLFDYILEHLVAEGYADTNEAALAIMANMSEEWREDIMEGMDMKAFKANRKKLKRREASADAKKRGHVSKSIFSHGRTYSPDEAKINRANMSDDERSARKSGAMNPDQVGDTKETADKTKNPRKLLKQKAMGEHG